MATICLERMASVTDWQTGTDVLRRGSVLLLLGIVGCCSLAPWRPEAATEDLPWCAPGRQATEESKLQNSPMAPAPQTRYRWVAGHFKRGAPWAYARTADKYLARLGLVETWPETGAGAGSITLRLAPYEFTIVSIHPVIVIMRPHDFGSPTGRSISDIVGSGTGKLHSRYLMNYYEYGTSFPWQERLLWFSPDLHVEPTAFKLPAAGTNVIEWCRGKLILAERQGVVQTRRQ
jgi:hypothetical protein